MKQDLRRNLSPIYQAVVAPEVEQMVEAGLYCPVPDHDARAGIIHFGIAGMLKALRQLVYDLKVGVSRFSGKIREWVAGDAVAWVTRDDDALAVMVCLEGFRKTGSGRISRILIQSELDALEGPLAKTLEELVSRSLVIHEHKGGANLYSLSQAGRRIAEAVVAGSTRII